MTNRLNVTSISRIEAILTQKKDTEIVFRTCDMQVSEGSESVDVVGNSGRAFVP